MEKKRRKKEAAMRTTMESDSPSTHKGKKRNGRMGVMQQQGQNEK
jgi:hypothetical protein